MKNLANALTISRIIMATVLLLFFTEISTLFVIIYTVALLTDMVDGTIARKTGTCSSTGALLDSVADFILDASLFKVVIKMKIMKKRFFIWLILALAIGMISPIINLFKHKKLFFIHSISCKMVMGLLIAVPFSIQFGFFDSYLTVILSLLTFSMLELVVMSLIMQEPDSDALSIYSVIKHNNTIKT